MAITESRVLPPQFIEDLATDFGKQLTAQTAVPLDTSRFAPTVAAQDPLQTQAITLAQQGIGSFQPFVTAAQQQAGQAATGIAGAEAMLGSGAGTGTGSIQDFMSPYQSQVIDATLTDFDRQRQIQEQAIRDRQAQLGVLGAGRAGVQLSEFGTGAARERALLQAQLLQRGFQDAVGRRQQDLANRQALSRSRLGLGEFQSGLASQLPGLQRADVSQLGRLGAIQQTQAQAEADAAREGRRLEAFEPIDRLNRFGSGVASLISGYPGQTTVQSVPNPTPLQTALGVGSTLAGIYGAVTNPQQVRFNVGSGL